MMFSRQAYSSAQDLPLLALAHDAIWRIQKQDQTPQVKFFNACSGRDYICQLDNPF